MQELYWINDLGEVCLIKLPPKVSYEYDSPIGMARLTRHDAHPPLTLLLPLPHDRRAVVKLERWMRQGL
ncbi:hypothetical protein [Halotalea alkalilenta]|uniref:hypothetical protein n=1 Tax=Halotalea alkalilenta TaxID=376489 RepID=UPI0004884992|nr:hypothetical protein [Halotalea alkalilenta]